jgi:hypothetical protein
VTTQEAFGIAAVRQAFQQQAGIERFTGGRIVDGFAVDLRGARAVVVGFGAAFDLQECTPIWVRRSTWAMARRSLEFMM